MRLSDLSAHHFVRQTSGVTPSAMRLLLVFACLCLLADAQCQPNFSGLCDPAALQPCCDSRLECLRFARGQCGSSDPYVEEFRCAINGGSAPAGIPVAGENDNKVGGAGAPAPGTTTAGQEAETFVETTTEEEGIETNVPAPNDFGDVKDETACDLQCSASHEVFVSSAGASSIDVSDLTSSTRNCGAVSLSLSTFSCSDVGDRINVDVTTATGASCTVPVSVIAARERITCKEDPSFSLGQLNDYVFQPNDVVEVFPSCNSSLSVLHSPVMLVCDDLPSRKVEVFYGGASITCIVNVVEDQCPASNK